VVEALERAGLPCALGGSGLLLALGLAETAHDWDVQCDAPPTAVLRALAGRDLVLHGSGGVHADHKVVTHGGRVEVIVRFAFATRRGTCRVPAMGSGRWRGVPLASPEAWAVAYALLGRTAKSERLFAHLGAVGADADAVARLRAEPLPADLDARLASLPPLSPAGVRPARGGRAPRAGGR
jgi:hypothetical protein